VTIPQGSGRLRLAFRTERCWLAASGPRTLPDVLDDLDDMLRAAKRTGKRAILVTDPREVIVGDDTGEILARALFEAMGTRGAIIAGPYAGVRAPARIRWKISAGKGLAWWIRGGIFAGWEYPGTRLASREGLMRWLPECVVVDPCAGDGGLMVAARLAGRPVFGVTDKDPGLAVAGLGQSTLFDLGEVFSASMANRPPG
jgi:hypothetical protein